MHSIQRITIFIVFLTVCIANSKAQFYSTGVDPASAKWEQIKTDNFQIIFQQEFESEAQKTANILEYHYNTTSKSLNHKPKRISVILHNQTVLSNGYVAWAPKRMELYVTPSLESLPDPWIEHLAIHEQRHVVQIDKLNQGVTKILAMVFGQQATALVSGQLPMWYYEGDAVCSETALLNFGRGRNPGFHQGIKANLLGEEDNYSFDQSLFGSYKTYVPNYYEFGYQQTAYARKIYGSRIWSDVETYVARNSYTLLPTPFAFYRGLKKHTGLSQKQLYQQTTNYIDSLWTQENESKEYYKSKFVQSYPIKDYENYLNPFFVTEDAYVALKKGLSHLPEFVLVNNSGEQVLMETGNVIADDFYYADNLLVWAEYKPDVRWSNREYTSIRLFNIKTKREHVLIDKSRYFSPSLSPGSDKMVVTHVDKKNQSSLVILDMFQGSVLTKIKSPKNHVLQSPRWSANGESIYVIEFNGKQKQVARYHLKTERWETLFVHYEGDIQKIYPTDDYVFFHSTFNGIDNIYAFELSTSNIFQISNSKYGIYGFSLDKKHKDIIANEYTPQGYRLTSLPVERALWESINQIEPYTYHFAEVLTEQESVYALNKDMLSEEFQVKSYRKYLNMFNFHSWIPFYADYNNIDVGGAFSDPGQVTNNVHPGVMLLSQNKLSTVDAVLSYAYKDENHFLSSSLVLKGQYPVLKLTANYGTQQLIRTTSDATWAPVAQTGYSYDGELSLPLNFNSGSYIKGIRPSVSVEYFDNYYYNFQEDYYVRGLGMMYSRLTLYSYKRKALRDIFPKVGVVVNLKLINSPFEKELYGYLYNMDAVFYVPGKNSIGFKFNVGYQYQNPRLYLFSGDFSFPRGIIHKRTEKLTKVYADYVFPIAYPDWNLGSALYVKRLRGDIFADYAYNTYKALNTEGSAFIWAVNHNFSFGIELTADYHLLRTIFPLSTGVRFGYAPTEENLFYEVIFGIDLYNF